MVTCTTANAMEELATRVFSLFHLLRDDTFYIYLHGQYNIILGFFYPAARSRE